MEKIWPLRVLEQTLKTMYENSEATIGLCVILALVFGFTMIGFAVFSDTSIKGCYLQRSADSHAIKLMADQPWAADLPISTHNDVKSAIEAASEIGCIVRMDKK